MQRVQQYKRYNVKGHKAKVHESAFLNCDYGFCSSSVNTGQKCLCCLSISNGGF